MGVLNNHPGYAAFAFTHTIHKKWLYLLAATSSVFSNVWRPYSNGTGQIAFTADLSNGQRQVIRDDGAGTTTIVQTPGQFSSASARGIDSNGTVLFSARLDEGGSGIFLGNGGPAVEIARTGGVFQEIRDSSLSDYQAVFVATPVGGGEGIYSFKNGSVTELFGPSDGFIGFLDFAINNTGGLIFLAGTGTVGGLYSVDDPTVPVVPIGAPFMGSTISYIEMFPSLNDAGQFAFLAELADYRHVLVRADPVPEPTCMGLLIAGVLMANRRRLRR